MMSQAEEEEARMTPAFNKRSQVANSGGENVMSETSATFKQH